MHYHNLICTCCFFERIPPNRAKLGYNTCMTCGELTARKQQHTIVPMNISNYMLVTDMDVLKQLNPKRT